HFDRLISRQQARIEALRAIDTPYVVLLDNNMMCSPGWLEKLLAARTQTGASMVSPIIVTHGGRVHFSGGFVVRRHGIPWWREGGVYRPHQQKAVPERAMLRDTKPRRVEIDFTESHCCLATTADLHLPEVFDERMHNAHTTCYASYRLKNAF